LFIPDFDPAQGRALKLKSKATLQSTVATRLVPVGLPFHEMIGSLFNRTVQVKKAGI
jgi:hypothetical protein